jgi:hypothetical protein
MNFRMTKTYRLSAKTITMKTTALIISAFFTSPPPHQTMIGCTDYIMVDFSF